MDIGRAEDRTEERPPFEQDGPTEFKSKQGLRLAFYAVAAAVDSVVTFGSFVVANLIHLKGAYPADGITIATVLLPLYLLIAISRQDYSSRLLGRWRDGVADCFTSFGIAAVALLFIAFYLHAVPLLSRSVFTIGIFLCVCFLVLSRWVLERIAKLVFDGHTLSQVLICDGVPNYDKPNFFIFDAEKMGLMPNLSDPHMLDRLGRLLKRADRVVVACPAERRSDWAIALKGANIRAELLVPEIDPLRPLGTGQFGEETTLLVAVGPLSIGNRALKRALDLSVATAALILLAPLMTVTAILIRAESEGPILFKQDRVGRGNRLFSIYKFRSMRAENSDLTGSKLTARGDNRVTRVGRVIRATSIDELPQILNVLKGEMSLVGPRPHALGALAGDQLYWEVDERYWHRHSIKPGITGLAQVMGFRGNTHLRQDLTNRLQADLDYIHGWTIGRDLRILIATLTVVVHKNAY